MTWFSVDGGAAWGTPQGLEVGADDSSVGIGSGGSQGWFYANYNLADQTPLEDVKIGRWDVPGASMSSGFPQLVLDADGGEDEQGGVNNSLWIENYSGSWQNHLFVAYQEQLGGRICAKWSQDQGLSWNNADPGNDGDYVDDCQSDGACGEARDVCLHSGATQSGSARLYAAFARADTKFSRTNEICFRYSPNEGQFWFSKADAVEAVVNLGATGGLDGVPPKLMKVESRPTIAVNRTTGHVFITYAAKGAPGDDGDVFLVKSTDAGSTWSAPIRVNQDATTHDQWNPWIAWDDSSGAIAIAFLDSRDFPGDDGVHTYLAVPAQSGQRRIVA